MRTSLAILAGAMLLMVAVPAATAQSAEAGASGGCSDSSDSSRPTPDVRPTGDIFADSSADTSVSTEDGVDLPDVVDAAMAAGNLAEGVVWDGQGIDFTNNCDGGGGWIEGHATASDGSGNSAEVQVCWNGNPGSVVSTSQPFACPTDDGESGDFP